MRCTKSPCCYTSNGTPQRPSQVSSAKKPHLDLVRDWHTTVHARHSSMHDQVATMPALIETRMPHARPICNVPGPFLSARPVAERASGVSLEVIVHCESCCSEPKSGFSGVMTVPFWPSHFLKLDCWLRFIVSVQPSKCHDRFRLVVTLCFQCLYSIQFDVGKLHIAYYYTMNSSTRLLDVSAPLKLRSARAHSHSPPDHYLASNPFGGCIWRARADEKTL